MSDPDSPPVEELMDTTNPSSTNKASPSSSESSSHPTLRTSTQLKDFSLSASELLPSISESLLDRVFYLPPPVPLKCQIHNDPEECKKTWGKSTTPSTEGSEQEEIETMESDFEIIPEVGKAGESGDSNSAQDFPPLPKPAPARPVSAFVSAAIKQSQRCVTENDAPTFSTSDDFRLDFYFSVMDKTSEATTISLLTKAWAQNPSHTLKLLANLRDIRKGKGIRPQYQQCIYWLYEKHPKTLFHNLGILVNFGYWKDILHLLTIIMFNGYMHPYFQKDANPNRSGKRGKKIKPTKYQVRRIKRYTRLNKWTKMTRELKTYNSENAFKTAKSERIEQDTEKRIYNQKILQYYNIKKKVGKVSGAEMTRYRINHARDKLQNDIKYRAFHIKIAELFASQLIKDLSELNKTKGEKKKSEISLAAKWAPTLEGHFDRYTLVGSTIALKIATLLPSDLLTSGKSIPVITYLARKSYSKEYCSPLRRAIEIPERPMSENKWDQVNYARVPAKSMTKNKSQFIAHDKQRFEAYLSVKKNKVAGASLKPVEIICQAMNLNQSSDPLEGVVIEKQWESLVESIQKGGSLLKEAISICDTSGSMEGTPMQAAIGLTLITMKVTSPPWNSICITFSEDPTLFHLDHDEPLPSKLEKMRAMQWGMSTDLHKVFQLIVNLGVENKLTNEQMPKVLFIFTDMEFNQACPGTNQTNFEAARSLFASKGYTLPTIAFWNLRDSFVQGRGTSTPVQKNEMGAMLLSGFAAQTLTYVMNAKDLVEISPIDFMMEVIDDERYKELTVFD